MKSSIRKKLPRLGLTHSDRKQQVGKQMLIGRLDREYMVVGLDGIIERPFFDGR